VSHKDGRKPQQQITAVQGDFGEQICVFIQELLNRQEGVYYEIEQKCPFIIHFWTCKLIMFLISEIWGNSIQIQNACLKCLPLSSWFTNYAS